MNYVMAAPSDAPAVNNSPEKAKQPQATGGISAQELDYVKQLVSLVLTRMEDKHRNMTEVFRFMDERGKGKVRKSDFISAIERARISLARDDVTKVWNYIDSNQQGYIKLQELTTAYANRINNFNKNVERSIETKATKVYN